MNLDWFEPRRYRHFDVPVGEKFARKIMQVNEAEKHSFSPLLQFIKLEPCYKKSKETGKHEITKKPRQISYASHRDACILSYYSHKLNEILENHYANEQISSCAIAYRSLGKSNYDFASEALSYATTHAPVVILAFDVSGFFDTLDHSLLKRRLMHLLNVDELPPDWYRVYRSITKFRYVKKDELKAHPLFGARLKEKGHHPIATVAELKQANIRFHLNPKLEEGLKCGIPQGTPISASASNLYMMDFDHAALALCNESGALYRRYSDDILIICKPSAATAIESQLLQLIADERLEIATHKTERTDFNGVDGPPADSKAAQYLGFNISVDGAAIRQSSVARQQRKLRKAINRARRSAMWRAQNGNNSAIYTKRLRRRFFPIKVGDGDTLRPIRNFSSYARRSAAAFGGEDRILRQARSLERRADAEIARLKAEFPPEADNQTDK